MKETQMKFLDKKRIRNLLGEEFILNPEPYLIKTRSSAFCYKVPKNGKFLFLKIEKHLPTYRLADIDVLEKIKRINNPNVVKYFLIEEDFDFQNNQLVVITATEYVPHDNIFDYLDRIRNSKLAVSNFILDLLKGYQVIHQTNILHKDINFSNIMVSNSTKIPKVFDINVISSISYSHLFISPEFMAPEVNNDLDYNIKSELWAIGVLLHVLLTNRFPFRTRLDGISTLDVVKLVKAGNYKIQYGSLYPPFDFIIPSLLETNPVYRPGSLLDILRELRFYNGGTEKPIIE